MAEPAPDLSDDGSSLLAAEQAALRRVATLVARGTPPEDVFAAITAEVGRLLPVDFADMSRCEPDGAVTFVAAWGATAAVFPVGSRWMLEGNNLCSIVARTGRPARIESYDDASGPIDRAIRDGGVRAAVGTPILVEGRLWGVMAAGSSREEPMPADTEARLTQFTELLATAVGNAESRARLARLADEQAALRRVATLIARAVPHEELFTAVAQEVGTLLGADRAGLARHEDDDALTILPPWSSGGGLPDAPGRVPLEGATLPRIICEQLGTVSAVGRPILVEGRAWGELFVASTQSAPLPADTEARLENFTDLLATAIANAQARAEVARLAQEQAALRRVATLVAREASQTEVFAAIAEEIGQLLGTEEIRMLRYDGDDGARVMASYGDAQDVVAANSRVDVAGGTAVARVFRTGRAVRIDDYSNVAGTHADKVRSIGIHTVAAAPIHVEGRLWGVMVAGTARAEALPPETERRLAQFTELMATTIANTESHARAERLTDEQAALRRVATLVAKESSPAELFAQVALEVANTIGDVDCALWRVAADEKIITLATWGTGIMSTIRPGERFPVADDSVVTRVIREQRPARIDDYSSIRGALAQRGREHGIQAAAGCPIVVGGRVWGVAVVAKYDADPLPPETEARVTKFTDLVATAIANAQVRGEVERLAEEQAALRRVATLVARGVPPQQVFAAVIEEVGRLLDADYAGLSRYEPGGAITVLASWGPGGKTFPAGSRWALGGQNISTRIFETGRPVRIEPYSAASGRIGETARGTGLRSVVGMPITVEGRLWGAMDAGTIDEMLPADTEQRFASFTELVATAIANADSRAAVARLAEEQAALRRVATLVAEGASPTTVLDAVAAEMERLLDADGVMLSRYEPDGEIVLLAHRGSNAVRVPPGTRARPEEGTVSATVQRTRRPARMDAYDETHGPVGRLIESLGMRAAVGAPIVVDGALWGVVVSIWNGEEAPPADTEQRMAEFAELLDTAIANADSRDQLTASRARLVTEADDARRRVVRDLHDGAQQRLVHTIVTLKLAQRAFEHADGTGETLVGEALGHAQHAHAEIREMAHEILPTVLARGGLAAGVEAMVGRLDLPVQVQVSHERFPTEIEASAYFIVAEGLTNVVKHAQARNAEVSATVENGRLQVTVRDDGVGGADPAGHGLVAIDDRVIALGGRLEIESPAGGGTLLAARLPLPGSRP